MNFTKDANLYNRVCALNTSYAWHLDTGNLEQWAAMFIESGKYAIHPRENLDQGLEGHWLYLEGGAMLRDRVTSLQNANLFNIHRDRHLISCVQVGEEVDGGFDARASYLVVQSDVEGHARLFSVGEYRDRIVDVEGELRFQERVVIPDNFTLEGLLAVPI